MTLSDVQVQHLYKDEAGRGLGSEGGDCASCCQTQCGKGKTYLLLSAESMNRDLQSTEYLNPPRQNDLFNKYFTM